VAAAKAKPEAITFGSIGNGSLAHLTMALLQQTGGFRMTHIPYKGGGPLLAETLGGQVDLAMASFALFAPHVKAARLRAIAVTGDRRTPVLPDVPALSEQGFPGFSALAWWGVFAPAGTPAAILDRFHAEVTQALRQPELAKQLTEQFGMDLRVSTPAGLRDYLANEIARWGRVVKENGIRAD
jgi:tripartite-type tricarboxylate transporter receptor subunit TctC